jgi:hypothetical protein
METRQYTTEEIREKFLNASVEIAETWGVLGKTPQEAAKGAVLTLLALLDGKRTSAAPAFMVIADPKPNKEGDRGYPSAPPEADAFNIGGDLCNEFACKMLKEEADL